MPLRGVFFSRKQKTLSFIVVACCLRSMLVRGTAITDASLVTQLVKRSGCKNKWLAGL